MKENEKNLVEEYVKTLFDGKKKEGKEYLYFNTKYGRSKFLGSWSDLTIRKGNYVYVKVGLNGIAIRFNEDDNSLDSISKYNNEYDSYNFIIHSLDEFIELKKRLNFITQDEKKKKLDNIKEMFFKEL